MAEIPFRVWRVAPFSTDCEKGVSAVHMRVLCCELPPETGTQKAGSGCVHERAYSAVHPCVWRILLTPEIQELNYLFTLAYGVFPPSFEMRLVFRIVVGW